MMFHARISEESAAQVIASLCAITEDEEARFRQSTLTATYEKGFDGEEISGEFPGISTSLSLTHLGSQGTSAASGNDWKQKALKWQWHLRSDLRRHYH